MGVVKAIVAGLGVGATAMYFGDPKKGKTRRALLRDKVDSLLHMKADADGVMLRDTRNRLVGLFYRTKKRFRRETPDDRQLVERVRAQIGHAISHPGALDIVADDGKVFISGPILEAEKDDLMDSVWKVDGVESIEHKLQLFDSPEGIPALQGELREEEQGILCQDWPPAFAMVAGLAGGLMAIYGFKQKSAIGTTLGAAGLGLVAKSFADVEGNRRGQKHFEGWG